MSKKTGHPAKQDPDVAILFKTMLASVKLVRDLEGRFKDDENFVRLRASALGLMWAYSDLTGLPAPDTVTEYGE